MAFVLSRVAALAAFALVLWILGALLDRLTGGRLPLPAPRPAGRILLGLLPATALLFALAAAGALVLPALLLAVALAVAAFLGHGWRHGFVEAGPVSTMPATPQDGRPPSGAAQLLAVALVALFAGLLLEALNPYPAWDAQVYHLTLPRLWIEAGGFVRVPFNVYSNWPANFQLLYAAAMLLDDYLVATLLHWGAAVLLATLLWRAAEPGAGAPAGGVSGLAGGLAATLFFANDLMLFEARAAYVDVAAALALLVAFLLAEEALGRGGEPLRLLAAGVALGYLAGLKPNGVLGGVALGAFVGLVELRRAGPARAVRATALLALPALALLLPWLWHAAAQTGNPFYPFLYERFGGPEWSGELTRRLSAWQRAIGMGREPLDYLLLPWRVVVEGGEGYGRFDGRLGLQWLAAGPLALRFARRRRVGWPLGAAVLAFALWAATSQQLRFLLPALALVALAAGRAAGEWLAGLPAGRVRNGAAAALAILALAALVPPAARELASTPTLARRYLADGAGVLALAVPPPYRALAELTPPGARVALLNTSQAFFCPRECLADSFFEASQLAAALAGADGPDGPDGADGADGAVAARERFRAIGVTHLLVDARPRGIDWPPGLGALLVDGQRAATLWRSPDGRFTLLELR